MTAVKAAPTIHDTLHLLKKLKDRFSVFEFLKLYKFCSLPADMRICSNLRKRRRTRLQAPIHREVGDDRSQFAKLLKIIETRLDRQEKSTTSKQLEEYIATWSQNQIERNHKTPTEINIEVTEMRKEWRCQKHLHIENLGFGIKFFQDVFSRTPLIQAFNPLQKASELKTLAELILDFLCEIIDERTAGTYLDQKGLESSLVDVQMAIATRTEELVKLNKSAWKYRVNPELIGIDIKRREILKNPCCLARNRLWGSTLGIWASWSKLRPNPRRRWTRNAVATTRGGTGSEEPTKRALRDCIRAITYSGAETGSVTGTDQIHSGPVRRCAIV